METIDTAHLYTNSFGEVYFQEINGKAFDNVGSAATFDKYLHELLNVEKTLFIFIGSDSGLLIPYLQRFQADKGRHYLILETAEMVDYIRTNIEIDPNIIDLEVYSEDFDDILEKHTDYVLHQRYRLIKSLSVLDGLNEHYMEMGQNVTERFLVFQHTQIGYSENKAFIDVQIKNLPLNVVPVSNIKELLENTNILILGGGPTLDQNIEWIRSHQDYLIIFAAGRIANRLKKENIFPDFFLSVDPNIFSFYNTKAILTFPRNPILLHSNSVNIKLLAEWDGLKAFTGSMFPWFDSQHRQPQNLNNFGPTVINTAAAIASYVEAKQVIFSGVDFCHAPDGRSHESGSLESSSGKYLHKTQHLVETNSGQITDTSTDYVNAKEAMEDIVAYSALNSTTQFYSIGKDSAKMENVDYKLAEDLNIAKIHKNEIMTKIRSALDYSLEEYKAHLDYCKSYTQEMHKMCRDALKLSKEGQKTASKLFNNLLHTDALTKNIIDTKSQLDHILGEHQEFIFNYSVHAYKDFMDPSIKEDTMNNDQIKSSFINYFKSITQSCLSFKESLDLGLKIINIRIDETSGPIAFNKITTYWEENGEPGRSRNWMKMHGLSLQDLSKEQQKTIKELLESFEEQINKPITLYGLQKSNPTAIYDKLLSLFKEKRAEDLSDFVHYIRHMESDYDTIDFVHLGQGFIYELRGDRDIAMDEYIQIKDSKLLAHGLTRVVSITLEKQDYENALNALEVLTNFSDEYFVAYADIMAALNNTNDAIAIYSHYLEKHEDDISTWIKLAKLLIYSGMHTEASKVLNNIKEKDPKNDVVNELLRMTNE